MLFSTKLAEECDCRFQLRAAAFGAWLRMACAQDGGGDVKCVYVQADRTPTMSCVGWVVRQNDRLCPVFLQMKQQFD